MNRFWLIGVPLLTVALAVNLFFLLRKPVCVCVYPATALPSTQSDSEAKAEQARSAQLEQELIKTRVESVSHEQKAHALEAALATNPIIATNVSAPANPLKDPETRRNMEKQQMQALDRKIRGLVNAELISKLNLSPEQADQLRNLLRQKQKPAVALWMALMAGDLDDAQSAEAGRHVNETIADADAQIRALLGPDGFAYFDRQEKMDDERKQVQQVKKDCENAGHSLRPEQQEQLLDAMFDERQKFKFTVDFNDTDHLDYTRFQDHFSEENLERYYSERQELNARIVARVEPLLDSDQRADFEHFLQEHLERGHATVRMTQALFPIKRK